MGINKVSVINSGSYINPNVFTRNISKSYETMGTQINIVADTLGFGDRAPVPDTGDARWSWVVESFFPENGTINPYTKGLDGTSIYVYAGTDYLGIDSLFLQINPEVSTEKRPATVYETFLNYKKYIDISIQQRTAALLSIVANNGVDLSGVLDGTILISTAEEIDVSSWRFVADYPLAGFNALRGPGSNHFISSAEGCTIDSSGYANIVGTNINLTGSSLGLYNDSIYIQTTTSIPTESDGGGTVYYSETDASLHLLDHNGLDTPLSRTGIETGDITFEGVKIIGAGTAGESGKSTIELVPDATLYANDQYLIIDPTSGGHIHIRPGGDIDNSNGVLFLGGEQTHVRISNEDPDSNYKDHSISLQTYNGSTTNYLWLFTNSGVMVPPLGLVNDSYGNPLTGYILNLGKSDDNLIITGPKADMDFPTGRDLIIQGQQGFEGDNPGDILIYGGAGNNLFSNNGGDIAIVAGDAFNAGSGGNITLTSGGADDTGDAGDITITAANSSGGGDGGSIILNSGTGTSSVLSGKINLNSNLKTLINSNGNEWDFRNDGYLYITAQKDIIDKQNDSSLTGGGNRVKTIAGSLGTYTVGSDTANSNIILVDNNISPTSITITLPDTSSSWLKIGYEITVLDKSGDAASKNITINPNPADTIIGASSLVIDTDYGLATFKYIGTKMWIIMYGR